MDMSFLSLDLFETLVQNVAILAILILLYNFIPEEIRSGNKTIFSLAIGLIFGFAAFTGIILLFEETGRQVIGINIILVPLAGFIGGIFSAIIVASVLVAGSVATGGTVHSMDMMTICGGLLIGVIFNAARTWDRFPRPYAIQLFLLGIALAGLEVLASALINGTGATTVLPGLPGKSGIIPAPLYGPVPPMYSTAGAPVLPSLPSLIPLFVVSILGILLLGALIMFIDQKKLAQEELVQYRDNLERLVEERTTELKKVNSLQKATIESTADAIVVTDLQGIIRAYNRKASGILRIYTLPKNGEKGASFSDVTASRLPSGQENLQSAIAALPNSAEQVVGTELVFRNGRIFELYVHPQQIGDKIIGRVWNFHDITDQRNAEDALKAANRKLILLSNITRHDILNQLTALAGYLDLAMLRTSDTSVSGYLDNMKKTTDIIRLQMEFTRDYQDIGLKEPVWQDVREAFLHAAEGSRRPGLTFLCDVGRTEIFVDPLIERVFHNLIDNSLRHGEHVSEIRLLSMRVDADLLLEYEDNGVGVSSDEKEKIFIKGHGKHTGLGLFLIREILSITGITIRETGTPGQGARFEIKVPAGKFRVS
ncbi:MAG TPA: PAS domain-containing sensor histidine kinase [Methanoregulaceae archaeon]|nr:PAS domain-containing sensor histidine kinase [Methanoregulaceae archaeon]HPD74929.1 PAS domain-containing sensor histidine kinase [Methanoregulaceae archaeon]HRY75778.1 PAS domain-containing sensor histidine kinase [Methanoregulaceae archaeon]